MMMRRAFIYSNVIFLFWAVTVSPTQAGIISYTVMDDNSGAGYAVGSAGTFMVPKYADPGGMPLTMVSLSVIGHSIGGSRTFDNEDPAGGTVTISIGTEVKVTGPIPAGGTPFDQLLVRAAPLNSVTGPVSGDNDGIPPDFIGTDSIMITGTGATDTQSSSRSTAFELTPYIGIGNVLFDFSTVAAGGVVSSTGGGGALAVFGDIRSDYTATVTYTFTSVPEPSSLAMLVITGLLSTGSIRRRSRSRNTRHGR